MYSASSNMASNFIDEDPSTSSVISLSSQPNSSSFQNSCTSLVSEIPLGSISDCLLPSLEEKSTPKSTYHSGGGITCCVPNCFNNSIRNKELSFYVIPKDSNIRKKWLHMLKRKNCPFVFSSSLFSPFCWRYKNIHEQYSNHKCANTKVNNTNGSQATYDKK